MVAHDLMTDFRYTKPAAFSLDEIRYPARMWKQMLVKICEILYQKNNKIFEEFLEDKFMQGKTRKYFSRNEASLRNPEKIKGSNIFVETNLSANSTRDMVMKMLDKYRIPYAAFKVYLSKDLSPLHKEDLNSDNLDEDKQEFTEEKSGNDCRKHERTYALFPGKTGRKKRRSACHRTLRAFSQVLDV